MNKQGFQILKELLEEVKLEIKEIGPCDHSVGICICELYNLVNKADQYIIDICTQKCSICKNVILLDESYIQNCDGVQHLNCYNKTDSEVDEDLLNDPMLDIDPFEKL